MTAASIRARVRAEMIEEIKTAARRHRATEDSHVPAPRAVRVLGALLRDGVNEGMLPDWADEGLPPPVHAELSRLGAEGIPGVPPQVLARGMTAWIQLFGIVSFEL